MKIERFDTYKKLKIPGETKMTVETDIAFKVSTKKGKYSLRVKIPFSGTPFAILDLTSSTWYWLAQDVSKEELENKKMEFLSIFSNFHKDANKYNL